MNDPGSEADANRLVSATIGQELRQTLHEAGSVEPQPSQTDKNVNLMQATYMYLWRNKMDNFT